MNINLKYIFYSIIVIAFFIGGYQCGNGNINGKEYTNSSDTVKIHTRDTVFAKDTIISFKDKPVPYPVYIDTNTYKPLPLDSLELNRFFVYNDSIEDKNVKIYSKIVTQGKTLNSFKPSYKLKVPLIIYDSTKITITDSVIIKEIKLPRYQLDAGVIAGTSILAPVIEFKMNNISYMAGYDPFSKKPIIGIKVRLWKSKK